MISQIWNWFINSNFKRYGFFCRFFTKILDTDAMRRPPGSTTGRCPSLGMTILGFVRRHTERSISGVEIQTL